MLGPRPGPGALWRFSPVPIQQPLLRRLLNKEELAVQAVLIYQGILRYMGDMPGRQSRVGIELTDLIFDGPLKQASSCLPLCGLFWLDEGGSFRAAMSADRD